MKPIPLLLNLTLLQGGDPQSNPLLLVLLVGVALVLLVLVRQSSLWRSTRKTRERKESGQRISETVTAKTGVSVLRADASPAIFISYRRDDSSDVTGRIYDRLIQHFGENSVFKDVDSIPLGADFRKHLGDSVGRCDVVLTVIGRQWLVGDVGQRRLDDVRDFVRIELEAALQRDIPVVPVLVQAAPVPRLEDLPETLQALVYRNGIPVRPDPDFHHDMDRLIKGIEGYLNRKGNQ
jgi:hypothetical protein